MEIFSENIEQYRSFLESSPDPIVIYNIKGEAEYINKAFEETFGWSREELIGQRIDFVPENNKEETLKAIEQLKAGRSVRIFETKRYTKKGNILDIQLSAAVHRDAKGNETGIIVIFRDITNLKRTQYDLHQSEKRFQLVVEESPYGISILNKSGNYKYLNPKFTEIFGYTIDDIPNGYSWFKCAFPNSEYRRKVISIWKRDQSKFNPGSTNIYNFDVTCKDKSVKTIQFKPITHENEDIFITYEDITQKVKFERRLKKSHLDLTIAYEELNYLNKLRDKVIDHLCHELKTPIVVLSGMLRVLSDRIEKQQYSEINKILERGKRSISRLIKIQKETEDIFKIKHDIIRFDDDICNDKIVNKNKISADEVLNKVCNKIANISKNREIEFVKEIDANTFIQCEKDVLEKCFTGILRNSVENTPNEGLIKIKQFSDDDFINTQILDHGIGITSINKNYIFDAFYQTQTSEDYSTKSQYEFNAGGLGSDLFRMKLYANRYGFEIDFKSKRCKFIPSDNDKCPGRISKCNYISHREECLISGWTIFNLRFPITD